MPNIQQPGAEFGRYSPSTVSTLCPLCDPTNPGVAVSIGSESNQWRCSNGHQYKSLFAVVGGPFRPVSAIAGAETRMDLTLLLEFKG